MEGSLQDGSRDVPDPSSKMLLPSPVPPPVLRKHNLQPRLCCLPPTPASSGLSPMACPYSRLWPAPPRGCQPLSTSPPQRPPLSQTPACALAKPRTPRGYSEERTPIWLRAGQRLGDTEREDTQLPGARAGNGCRAYGFGGQPFPIFSREQIEHSHGAAGATQEPP